MAVIPMSQILQQIGAFFANLAVRYGVIGLAIGMFAESLGIPTASVVLELTAGPLIVAGKTSYLEAVIFATIGLTLGSVVSYYMGYFGADLGKKLMQRGGRKAREQQSKLRGFLKKYGDVGILLAQLFGPFRTWISVPAGAIKMDIKKFVLYTAVGGAIYCSITIGFSYVITSALKALYLKLLHFLHPFANVLIIVAIVALIIAAFYMGIRQVYGDNNSEAEGKAKARSS